MLKVLDAFGIPQSALVIGGSSDIAVATLRQFIDRGLKHVLLAGRSVAALSRVASDLEIEGLSQVETMQWDVSDPTRQTELVSQAFDSGKDIDLVLVAAGILGSSRDGEANPAEVGPVMMTNYVGIAAAMLALASRLREQGHGTIVLLSSVAAMRPRKSNYVYGSSKAGIDFFARGLSQTLDGSGVRVVIVRPGFVRTKMTLALKEAPFSASAEDVARAIVRGLARKSDVIWVPAILKWVFLVVQHLPSFAWSRIQEREER